MGKTKGKRRPSSEQEQTKEQVRWQGFKEAHGLAMVNKGQNPRKKPTSTKQKQTAEKVPQRSFKNARRHSFCTMNPTTKNNPDSFLEVALSQHCFLLLSIIFFLLTADTFRDEALVASLFEGWLNHEPLSLSARFCLLSGWNSSIFFMFSPGFVLLFIQGRFSVLERFMTTKWTGFESGTTVIECKQKMLSSWNGVFAAKSRWGVNELWGLWHLGDLLTFIKKSLFVDNFRAFL